MGDLIFLSPWILTAISIIPVLWLILRALPPKAKNVNFPAFFLLKDIESKVNTAAHSPWWLLFIRALMLILFIVAFANPVLHPVKNLPSRAEGNVLFIIDNDWASAANWQARKDKLQDYVSLLKREDRSIIFIPTTPSEDSGKIVSYGPMTAGDAEKWLYKQQPVSWPSSYDEVLKEVKSVLREKSVNYSIFASNGLRAPKELLSLVQTVIYDDNVNNPYILRNDAGVKPTLDFVVARVKPKLQVEPLILAAYAADGAIVDELKFSISAGQTEKRVSWDILPELKEKIFKISLQGKNMASTVFLANAGWKKHPVGIISGIDKKDDKDFLSEIYYLRRALESGSKLTIDSFDKISGKEVSVLILPDSTALTSLEKVDLMEWVKAGGFLIRYAGPNLAAQVNDGLLPVPLRYGQRAMSGSMTWEKPLSLADIAQESPFYGLAIPEDITVSRQVLAEPSPEVFAKTWVQLKDGTPLVTGAKTGKGTIVLVHTTASPSWSNLCYSGLYVEMLERIISLSNGINNYQEKTAMAPLMLVNGFGNLLSADKNNMVTSVKPDEEFNPSPITPPGIYGDKYNFKVLNLGDALPKMDALNNIPSNVNIESYAGSGELSLKPLFLKLAVVMIFVELLSTLWVRGIVIFATLILTVVLSAPASAETKSKADLINGVHLAYVETDDSDIDSTSYNGLTGLGEVITQRTSIKISGVAAINIEDNDMSYYPFVYWPMSAQQKYLSLKAVRNVQNYLSHGGIILFDTRDQQFGNLENTSSLGVSVLRRLTQNLQIPELVKIGNDNILSRSFYLLENFPGRYAGGELWVEKEPDPRYDSVTSVIIGSNDWAAVWSKTPQDLARYVVMPGGERQREMAYRFGVNLVMVALTGNYKADQIHISHILERIGK